MYSRWKKGEIIVDEIFFTRFYAFQLYLVDGNSQLDVLHMVANKQAEVGVLEAPVIRCQKLAVIGAEFLHILASLGPLPPYRIMINKAQGIIFLYPC